MHTNLKKQVKAVLQEYPESRNSDITLMILIWRRFYGVEKYVDLMKLYDLPREDNVKRIRAKYCEEKHNWAYPTDIKIMRARKIKEDEWRSALGYVPAKRKVFFEHNFGGEVVPVDEDKVDEFLKLNPNARKLS